MSFKAEASWPDYLKNGLDLFNKFKAEAEQKSPDAKKVGGLQNQLKLALTTFPSLPPSSKDSATATQELMLAREFLELSAQLAVTFKNVADFERVVQQLKSYYTDCKGLLPESSRQNVILGLNLLRLLSQNRIAEFHVEVELISIDDHSNVYIMFPLQLERYLMEGSYNKILKARAEAPAESYLLFMDIFSETVRDAIADCSEKSYDSLLLKDAMALLWFTSEKDLLAYANKREWVVDGKNIVFKGDSGPNLEIPSTKIIRQTLSYAKELERIV